MLSTLFLSKLHSSYLHELYTSQSLVPGRLMNGTVIKIVQIRVSTEKKLHKTKCRYSRFENPKYFGKKLDLSADVHVCIETSSPF